MTRMRTVVMGLAVTAACAAVAPPASASTLTLGWRPGTEGQGRRCDDAFVYYTNPIAGAGYTYAVPPGGGAITQWGSLMTGAAGDPVTLVVLRPGAGGDPNAYTLVDADRRQVPFPPPVHGLDFTIDTPIRANGGDLIGLYSSGIANTTCFVDSEAFAPANMILGVAGSVLDYENGDFALTPGRLMTALGSWENARANVWATVVQAADATVTGAVLDGSLEPGDVGAYAFTVTNNGPGSGEIVFSGTLSNSLPVLSAVAGSGTCTVSGPAVRCSFPDLPAGASAPVSIIVQAPAAGTYTTTASVSATDDRAPANNTAAATLTVVTAPARQTSPLPCKTVLLKGLSLKLAKQVIAARNCKVGKVTKAKSKKVKKGLVISTSPGAGKTLANGAKIKLVQSSGRPKKKRGK
jgi:hypothetical protein